MLINLIVPTKEFDSLNSIYVITWKSVTGKQRLNTFAVIEGDEEDFVSLLLKYGTDRVWLR